jgi:hypothetical protein
MNAKHPMTFDQEMEFFFRNYTQEDRQRVESDARYQDARNNNNAEKAERIGCEIIEGNMPSKIRARMWRKLRAP